MGKQDGLEKEEEQIRQATFKARQRLEEKGSASAAQLGAPKVRQRVMDGLLQQGFEKAGKGLRVPLEQQGLNLLTDGAHIPVSSLRKRLACASATEAKELARKLTRDGHAHLVLRAKQLTLVPKQAAALDRAALTALTRELKAVLDWTKKALADKASATVLLCDVRESVEELMHLLPEPKLEAGETENSKSPSDAAPTTEPLALELRGAILASRDEDSLLASVPDVSRRLRPRASAEDVISELLSAHKRGELELRPEGGIGRLSDADAVLCPVGAAGVRLSWIRLLEN